MIKIFYLLKNCFLNFKYSFFFPPKKKVLIYDNNNLEFFKKYLKKYSYQILYTRNEAYCIPILLYTIIKKGIKDLKINYKKEFIKRTNCKVVLTMTDNDLEFLKIDLKGIKKIAIQNAYRRDSFPDLFSFLKYEEKNQYTLDYIFCFNKFVGKVYKKYLNCKYIPIGSLRNNLIKLNKNEKKNKNIIFISQYRYMSVNKKKNFIFENF